MSRKHGWSVASAVKWMEAWITSPYGERAKVAISRVVEKDVDLSQRARFADACTLLELLGLYEGAQGCILAA